MSVVQISGAYTDLPPGLCQDGGFFGRLEVDLNKLEYHYRREFRNNHNPDKVKKGEFLREGRGKIKIIDDDTFQLLQTRVIVRSNVSRGLIFRTTEVEEKEENYGPITYKRIRHLDNMVREDEEINVLVNTENEQREWYEV